MAEAAASFRVRAFLKRYWASLVFLVLALGIWGWVSWEAIYVRMITWEGGADYWEHSATLHALTENPWHPRHPHLATNGGSPRFGPQFLLVALVARALHWDALAALSLASVLNTLLFLSGIYVFFSTYFRHRLAPLYGLLVMFGGWWLGFHYSNVYSLPVFFIVSPFPSTTALGLTMFGFALTVRLLRGEVQKPAWALALLGVWAGAVFIIHPLTAMMSLTGAGLLAICQTNVSHRRRAEVIAAVALGTLLSHFWPYFSPWLVVRGGHGQASTWASESVQQVTELVLKTKRHEFYEWHGLVQALGIGLLTVISLPFFLLKRERWFVSLGALSMLLPFVANLFIDLPLGHRFVLLAIVYLHIGVVWLLLCLTPGYAGAFRFVGRRWGGLVSGVLVAALLLVFSTHSVLQARETLSNRKFYARPESPVVSNARAVAAAAGDHAVILANPLLSWVFPSFGPKGLVLFHTDPLVADQEEREYKVKRFLGPYETDEQRRATLAHYGVTHVLLGRESGPVARFLAKTSTVRSVGTGFRLYTLEPSAKQP